MAKKEIILIFLLIAIPFCSYLNSLDGSFVFDDSRIYNNPSVKLETFSITGLVRAVRGMEPATRPVANLTFVLNYLFNGFATRGYHLVNLCIHITAGLFLYFLLKTILSQPILQINPGAVTGIAFASTLIWLVHPLQTQAVSYIVQRMASLAALFFTLSLFFYARGRLTKSTDQSVLLFAGSILTGVLAIGSKENAFSLPLFILLYEYFFVQNLHKNWLAKNKYYIAGTVVFLVVVAIMIMGNDPWTFLKNSYTTANFSPTQRVLTESRVLFFYLGLLAFPFPGRLSNEHDFALSTSLFNPPTTLLAIAAILIILILTVWLAPKFRFEAFCILWFLGNHLMEGSIIPLELVFEHRNYLPSMMLIPLVVICTKRLIASKMVLTLLLCTVIVLFSYWTYQRNIIWRNELSLWSDGVQKAPNSARAHNNLAVELEGIGKIDEAIHHYHKTILLDPEYVPAYYNLGMALIRKGDITLGIQNYRKAVSLAPDDAVMQMSLANELLRQGSFDEARTHYLHVIRLDPKNIEARMKLRWMRNK